ncbi:MAG: hypothetical protein U0640_06865 [Phycisphaerales bacterium]
MANLFRRLLNVLAGSTDRELPQQVQYLKLENEILRYKITGRVRVSPQIREAARIVDQGARQHRHARHVIAMDA